MPVPRSRHMHGSGLCWGGRPWLCSSPTETAARNWKEEKAFGSWVVKTPEQTLPSTTRCWLPCVEVVAALKDSEVLNEKG